MQSPYRLPNPLPPLPVRKGVRGRRPKSETIALLKAVAEAAAAQNGSVPENTQLVPRVHKKRGPKPGSKVRPSFDCLICYQPHIFIKFFPCTAHPNTKAYKRKISGQKLMYDNSI